MATTSSEENLDELEEQTKPPFLRRVHIQGYKSIGFCEVVLEPLTILVGRNGAGKSNFLDALAFLRDVLDFGVRKAVSRRGKWTSLTCRTPPVQKIEIEVEANFTCGESFRLESVKGIPLPQLSAGERWPDLSGMSFNARYALTIAGAEGLSPIIVREYLYVADSTRKLSGGITVENGIIERFRSNPGDSLVLPLPHSRDLLPFLRPDFPLLSVIGIQPFIDLAGGLRGMGFFNLNPEAMRYHQKPLPGAMLEKDGRNLASAILRLQEVDPVAIERIRDYLHVIVPEVEGFAVVSYGDYETVRFRLKRSLEAGMVEFDANSMSDGTLRVLAALVAASQHPSAIDGSVVGIEEPGNALHPMALQVLLGALDGATLRNQILLTTHSAELLDNPTVQAKNLRVVEVIDGRTVITPVDVASQEIVQLKLNTLGGLERENRLELDVDDVERQKQPVPNGF